MSTIRRRPPGLSPIPSIAPRLSGGMRSMRFLPANHSRGEPYLYSVESADKIPKVRTATVMFAPAARQNRGRCRQTSAGPGLSPGRQTRYESYVKAGPQSARSEEDHGSQNKLSGFLHRAGHAVQEWLAG